LGFVKRASAVVALALAAGALGAGAASAQTVTSGSFAFSGDAGDYISGGGSYQYSVAANDRLNVASNGNHINVSVNGANGDWWYLDLAAPSGQTLAPGTYDGATRYPFQTSTVPGLSLYGNGRGCNTLTGSFTIQNVVFGPYNYVQQLDATYEQHCEGGTSALRGEVHIDNPPAPAELGLGLSVATDGTASTLDGKATVHGTVTCTQPVKITVSGGVTQVTNKVLVRGQYWTQVDCTPSAAVTWSASADPTGATPYRQGDAEVTTTATAQDPNYPQTVTRDTTTVVSLKKA
jgi:hypothetical protein